VNEIKLRTAADKRIARYAVEVGGRDLVWTLTRRLLPNN
jgi:hypothetical protein